MSEGHSLAARMLEPLKSPDEAKRLLKEGARTGCAVMLWTQNQETVLNTFMTGYYDKENFFYVILPTETDEASFSRKVSPSQTFFFSLSLPRANLFFKSLYLEIENDLVKFDIPSVVYKVQRRKDFRYAIPHGHVLKVEFPDPIDPDTLISRKVVDISAGGLSIAVSKDESYLYSKGSTLGPLTFSFKSRKITCLAEIRHVQTIPPGSIHQGEKIGMSFKNISPEDARWVEDCVQEESRRYLSRFI